jgi:hypothetical protein
LRWRLFFRPALSAGTAIVKRLATYADLLGIPYSDSWRQDAAWIAEQALNKPLILKLDERTSAGASHSLSAMLAASGTSVEIVWSEPAGRQGCGRRVRREQLSWRIPSPANMFPTDSATSPFSIAVDGVGNGEHRWFGGGQSDLVIVARVNGSSGSPKTVKLQSARSGPFEIKWYDPATGARSRPAKRRRLTRASRRPAPAPASTP